MYPLCTAVPLYDSFYVKMKNKYQISGRAVFESDQAVSTTYVLNNDLSIFRQNQILWFISHRKLSLFVRMVETSKIRSI